MILLCIETSADPSVIGLVKDGQLLQEVLLADRDLLPAAVAQLLSECGKQSGDINVIAIGIGPGSFTGLRVGLAYAKGMARALSIPIWPVPSLQIFAANLRGRYDSIVAFAPARRGQAHVQKFNGSDLSPATELTVMEYESIRTILSEHTVLVGPAVTKLDAALQADYKNYIARESDAHRAHSLLLAELAGNLWAHTTPPAAGELVPVYGLEFGK
ncbi:tRNA (adenosine(37)-N6)-threonylcarbamoyltransferase complex dimerization subunit type 1 TsaB [bacterium]|nr:tRNA (adenosine(37)-N6)-threonylcarbamoyltransferase complex dimerization subunit type 1 TsaB [bacterium]MBU1920515.1 tRNA (adenosine(37)-N6)-threonylcarbamoyltransferase complex dimerization subunit type 1 TsaB [bacterium]